MARKRGNNDGSIHKRKNGTWRAQITLEGHRLSFSAKTRRDCIEWLKKTQNQIDLGLTYSGSKLTLCEFLDNWFMSIESSLRKTTWRQYNQIARDHIKPTLGAIKLKDLRPDHIQNLYDSKLRAGLGARTIQLAHAVLRRSLGHAEKLGIIVRNPVKFPTPLKTEYREMKFYDESQVSLLLLASKGNRNEALYYLAVTTGMRQSELLGLQWSDLDWQKKTLKVHRQLNRLHKEGELFLPPKTRAGMRTIVLGKLMVDKLRDHWESQNKERIKARERWQEYNLIFPSSTGTPMDYSNLIKNFKGIIERAGLPEIRFHDLRHTAASLMLNHGVPTIVVSRRLGHSKVSITLDIYGHLIPEFQDDAAKLMDTLVTPVELRLHQGCTRNEALIEE